MSVGRIEDHALKLPEKGRQAARPTLPRHAGRVAATLDAWPGVNPRAYWRLGDETEIDGADFYYGQDELGHLHLDGEAHVAVGRKLREVLVEAGLAEPFPWSREFVRHEVSSATDVKRVLFVFEIAHARRKGEPHAALEARIAALR